MSWAMPGRKNPPMTESEKKREYRLMNKRGYGEGEIPDVGAAGEIERERRKWAEERDLLRHHRI